MFVVPLLAVVLTSSILFQRYMVICLPGLLLLSAIGLANLMKAVATRHQEWVPWRVALFLTAVLGIWLVTFVVPFFNSAYTDPSALALPYGDKREYVSGWASGYGVREAATYLLKQATDNGRPLTSVGMVGNCRAIPMFLPSNAPVAVFCATINSTILNAIAEQHNFIRQQIAQNGAVLVLVEINGPYSISPLPTSSQLLATFPRPDGTATVELFRVSTLWPTF